MAVKIRRERPDQRRHHRVTAPLFALVAGHRVRAADWSLGGLRIEEFPFPIPGLGIDMVWNPWLADDSFRAWMRGILLDAAASP